MLTNIILIGLISIIPVNFHLHKGDTLEVLNTTTHKYVFRAIAQSETTVTYPARIFGDSTTYNFIFKGNKDKVIPINFWVFRYFCRTEIKTKIKEYFNCALSRNSDEYQESGDVTYFSLQTFGHALPNGEVFYTYLKRQQLEPLHLGCVTIPVRFKLDIKIKNPTQEYWEWGTTIFPQEHPIRVCLMATKKDTFDILFSFFYKDLRNTPFYYSINIKALYESFGDYTSCAMSTLLDSWMEAAK